VDDAHGSGETVTYRIETATTIGALQARVQVCCNDGFDPIGAPFFDSESRYWCQAVMRRDRQATSNQLNLREPQRSRR
jgi:hypothetical protein